MVEVRRNDRHAEDLSPPDGFEQCTKNGNSFDVGRKLRMQLGRTVNVAAWASFEKSCPDGTASDRRPTGPTDCINGQTSEIYDRAKLLPSVSSPPDGASESRLEGYK